ncbi:unnamed protein product [Notodromas monacha]|uniref:CUB domain-containing protein n=1 Tax=Notodromas monacha TaxID=399045 RepID=A0A7R9GHG8_9CRUS|nr:unnamed protein product [Notodromas monacha]CAG0921451.1 unnamed protein product [Notodromas monacha]
MQWLKCFYFAIPWLLFPSFAEGLQDEYDLSDPAICDKYKYVVDLYHGAKSQTVIQFDGEKTRAKFTSHGMHECALEIRAPHDHHIGVVFMDLNLRRTNEGCLDSVTLVKDNPLIFDEVRDLFSDGTGKICGNLTHPRNLDVKSLPERSDEAVGNAYISGTRMDVKFRLDVSDPYWKNSRVRFVVTAYYKSSSCQPQFFNCGNKVCVSKVLVCNGFPNCGFRDSIPGSDESNCTNDDFANAKLNSKGLNSPRAAVWVGITAGLMVCISVGILLRVWRQRRANRAAMAQLNEAARGQLPVIFYDVAEDRIEYQEEQEAEVAAKNAVPPPSYDSLFDEEHPPPAYHDHVQQ